MDPQTRETVTRITMGGLVATTLAALSFGTPSCNISRFGCGGDSDLNAEIKYVGKDYAVQNISGCELVRRINNDGTFGDVYDIPLNLHIDLPGTSTFAHNGHRANPRAVVIVRDADDPSKCRVLSQPVGSPYRP